MAMVSHRLLLLPLWQPIRLYFSFTLHISHRLLLLSLDNLFVYTCLSFTIHIVNSTNTKVYRRRRRREKRSLTIVILTTRYLGGF
ncbi:hypothetical protein GDO78_018546 [Eleutherodactylus coqui]|uniref:Uncharacterized protein n=1 Tax=Eleutherodactylus coqui TaxID=57060 RepID=A0A8J6EAY9_ELECQ|nr:hypothetical protein GDO78_018546 [Eleutherodactylus coqui]